MQKATVALFLILFGSTFLLAQRSNTTITGTITDPSGAAIPQAQVVAVQNSTGATSSSSSDAAGFYVLTNLAPGVYRLTVQKTGFESYAREGVVLESDRPVKVDVSMSLGSTRQSVTISAAASQVDVRDQTLTTVITPEMARELPLNGRNILQLMSLAPDVSPSIPSGYFSVYAQQASRPEDTSVFVSASGGRANSTAFYLDGGIDEDPYTQIANIFPNPDAIQEFTFDSNNYSAKFGGRGGGVVNAVTQSGANAFHGSAFEFVRNGALNARNFFASENDGLKRNQYGFTFGGPVQKDKTFFFLGWQATSVRQRPTQNVTRTFTAAELNGNFSEIPTPLVDPNTGTPFPNNQIPVSNFDPVTAKLFPFIPVGAPGTGLAFYATQLRQDDRQWIGRVDRNFGEKLRVFGRYIYDNLNQPGEGVANNVISQNDSANWRSQNLTLSAAYTLRPNLLTTVSGTFNRVVILGIGPKSLPGPTEIGANIPNLITGGSKTSLDLGIGGYFGTFWDGIYRYPRNEMEYANNWTYIRGRHTLEFGADAKWHERITADQDYESEGGYSYSGQLSGDNLVDFMLGKPSFFAQYAPAYGTESRIAPALYVTDAWSVTHRLALNLGVRWSPWATYDELAQNAVVMLNPVWFQEGLHSTRYPNLPSGILMADDPGIPRTGVVNDYHVFAPRVGFAYDLFGNGKTSIRGGFGIYHDEPSGNGFNGGIGEPPTDIGVTFPFPASFANPYAGQVNPFTFSGPPPSSTVFPLPLGIAGLSPDIQQPTIQQWNFTVEHQLASSLMIRAAYEGSEGYHMYTGIEGNPAIYIPGQSTLENEQQRRPNPNIQYALVQKTLGTASFNSLTLSAEKRMAHGLSFIGGFRWAKCLDEVSQFTGEDINDPNNVRDQRGLCDYDISHQFTFSNVWEPSVPQSFGHVGGAVLGHWQLNGILTWRAGFPYSISSGIDNALEGPAAVLDRADLTGVSPNLPGNRSEAQKLNEWFNVNAFTNNALGTFGNSPRNFLRGPGYANLDFAVIRSFPIKIGPFAETQHLDFRAEFFNIFNHPNFQNPNSDAPALTDGPVLGQILGAYDPRILQFALKFVF